MKYLKTFENYTFKSESQEKRYKPILDKIYNAKVGDILDNDVIYQYVEFLTDSADKYEESFVDGDLGERIDKYDKFILKLIPIDKINIDEFYLYQIDVDNYGIMYNKTKTYPPIVLEADFTIIDGTHRANALHNYGVKDILAFVGIK
jgi:hypothetical protein